ncbi:MAG TPA: hypothetical protein VGK45_05055 [Thermoanaerobaculia bacterium]
MSKNWLAALTLTATLLGVPAFAGAPKTYQVTGPVLELTSDMIVVKVKGSERWEIARTPDTKVSGDLKVGSTVTIQYRMTAASVEVKAEKAPAAKKGKKG